MSDLKKQIIDLVQSLPDDCTYEDIQYHLYVRENIERGLKDVEEGRFIPHQEAKARFQEWLRSIGPQPHSTNSPSSATT